MKQIKPDAEHLVALAIGGHLGAQQAEVVLKSVSFIGLGSPVGLPGPWAVLVPSQPGSPWKKLVAWCTTYAAAHAVSLLYAGEGPVVLHERNLPYPKRVERTRLKVGHDS